MLPLYNLTDKHEAWYNISQDGITTVTVRSKTRLKPRAIYAGLGTLSLYLSSLGRRENWKFTPSLPIPTKVQYNERTDEGQNQIINVSVKNMLFPATGLIKSNVTGEITAPAVHFDLPHANDLWLFILRSPWFPIRIQAEKSSLTISHGSAQATAQIESINADQDKNQILRANVSVHGEGFKHVQLVMERTVGIISMQETIGSLNQEIGTFVWKPSLRAFNTMLLTFSNMGLPECLDFLKALGAQTNQRSFSGSVLENDFLLSDGPTINYTLQLIGEKHILGHEKSETKIILKP